MLSDIFSNKFKLGIFGYGVTGQAVARWCDLHNIKYLVFDDKHNLCERFTEDSIKSCNLIVRSPSFLNENKWIKFAESCGIQCVGELDLGAYFWRGKVIAVTGTDGKTTTTEFLTHALKHSGYGAVAIGNNGSPFINIIDSEFNNESSYAVVEVSSFQAESLQLFRPDYVLWTNFASDHIDAHYSLHEYFAAKYKIIELIKKCDEKHVFIGESVLDYTKIDPSFPLIKSQYVHTNIAHLPHDSSLNISVQHENYALIEHFWITLGFSIQDLKTAASSFVLTRHRLQKIATVKTKKNDGYVSFWNDSKATNFHSFKAALDSFEEKLIVIVGGKSKEEDLILYVTEILNKAKIVLSLGYTGKILYEELCKKDTNKVLKMVKFYGSGRENAEDVIAEIVSEAFSIASKGDHVLFSPGFSSFDMFDNFEQRGNFYEKYVLRLC